MSPQALEQSPELSLFPLEVMLGTECQPGSEHLSRLPESWDGTARNGVASSEEKVFLPFSLFTAAELLPPYPTCF